MNNYQELYLNCGVLALAEVFEDFRNNSLEKYRLCPSLYLISPNISWDKILKMIKIKHELIADLDMYLSFEKRYKS